jgi:hypothetical protein
LRHRDALIAWCGDGNALVGLVRVNARVKPDKCRSGQIKVRCCRISGLSG